MTSQNKDTNPITPLSDEDKNKTIDKTMVQLMQAEQPIPLGIPGWLLQHVWTRPDYPLSAHNIAGPRPGEEALDIDPEDTLNAQYGFRKGYQFSWGSIAEESAPRHEDVPEVLHFYIFPDEIMRRFPDATLLSALMEAVYVNHSLYNENFDIEDGHAWDAGEFLAFGKSRKKLRKWMCDVFLPSILPDFLEAGERVASAYEKEGDKAVHKLLVAYGVDSSRIFDGSRVEPEKAFFIQATDTLH